jgi:hypothetical protein
MQSVSVIRESPRGGGGGAIDLSSCSILSHPHPPKPHHREHHHRHPRHSSCLTVTTWPEPRRHPVIPSSRHPVIPSSRHPVIPSSRHPAQSVSRSCRWRGRGERRAWRQQFFKRRIYRLGKKLGIGDFRRSPDALDSIVSFQRARAYFLRARALAR